jgi:Fic-DOC domain mobile mystery protein B
MIQKPKIHAPSGATPLEPEELEGLIPTYITTHSELNELEQQNIQDAVLWALGRKTINVTDAAFLHELHKQMFGGVWKWAGRARKSGKNIGVDWHQIATQLGLLLGDVRYWLEHKTYPVDEIGTRFHHRLVQIHVFPNGNGRHARLATDLLLETQGRDPFSWGANTTRTPIETEGARREQYIAALKAADQGDYELLLAFVRT